MRYLPPDSVYQFHETAVVEGQVERATRPESIALAVFGLIALFAALLVGAQVLRREVVSRREESEVVRALGADRATRVAAVTLGPLCAIVLGGVVAVGVAIALSPLSPLGAVRAVEPDPGVSLDGLVLGAGAALLVAILGAVTIGVGVRASASRPRRPGARAPLAARGRGGARWAADAGRRGDPLLAGGGSISLRGPRWARCCSRARWRSPSSRSR